MSYVHDIYLLKQNKKYSATGNCWADNEIIQFILSAGISSGSGTA